MTEPQCFPYHRSVAPLMWVLVALASIELVIVHLLVSLLWSRIAALLLSAVTVAGVGWLVAVIRSMKRLPVLLDGDRLVMRAGMLKSVTVPLTDVAGLRGSWDGEAIRQRDVLNLALLAYPNVVVDLKQPRRGRPGIRTIAHRLDDPAAFTAAMEGLVPAAPHGSRNRGAI